MVGGKRHLAAQGVDLLNEVSLADSTNGGVTRHEADSVYISREDERPAAHTRARERSLAAGVTGPYDDDVVIPRIIDAQDSRPPKGEKCKY